MMKRMVLAALLCGLYALGASAQEKETKVAIDTNKGLITIKLYNETPRHRDNFIKLVKEHQYDGVLFHRVIKDFMIQAGDVKAKNAPLNQPVGEGDLDYTVPAEIVFPKLYHKRGQVAAAREGDDVNPERASSAAHFYIVEGKKFTAEGLDKMEQSKHIKYTPEQRKVYMTEGGTPHLDNAYTVFGEVVSGMDVVDSIQVVPTDPATDRPRENVVIRSMKIVED